jgi:hypothetical protein
MGDVNRRDAVRLAAGAAIGLAVPAAQETRGEEPKKAPEPYEGFKADQASLRKHQIYKAKDGGKDTHASSGEACEAAQRIFTRVSFLFKTREEVLNLLGDPATISDYNKPAGKGPSSPLVYLFDSGFGGLKYTLSFGQLDRVRVNRVQVESQN